MLGCVGKSTVKIDLVQKIHQNLKDKRLKIISKGNILADLIYFQIILLENYFVD